MAETMSIDYDMMREWLADTERGDFINRDSAQNHLGAIAPDIARELLRLRDGVVELRDDLADLHHAGRTYRSVRTVATVPAHVIAHQLTDLLEGDK